MKQKLIKTFLHRGIYYSYFNSLWNTPLVDSKVEFCFKASLMKGTIQLVRMKDRKLWTCLESNFMTRPKQFLLCKALKWV